MKIGKNEIDTKVIAAPMAGITDKAYRILAARHGCKLAFSEMISAAALMQDNGRTKAMLDFKGEGAVAAQIFGSDSSSMAKAAKLAENAGALMVDINMGCPTPKIVKNGEGAALMLNPKKAGEIVEAVVRAVNCPVTVKIRKGWDNDHLNAVEVARVIYNSGAAAVTVHGRTREQFYRGKADWQSIAEVAEAIPLTVIGSGDLWGPRDALEMLESTGCQAVMLARGALGNPWLFTEVESFLASGKLLPTPEPEEKIDEALRHLQLMVKFKGEFRAVKEMRKHFSWYLKGMRDASPVKNAIMKLTRIDELEKLLQDYISKLMEN